VVCTTDDPVDNLEHHRAFANPAPDENVAGVPSDKALTVNLARRDRRRPRIAARAPDAARAPPPPPGASARAHAAAGTGRGWPISA